MVAGREGAETKPVQKANRAAKQESEGISVVVQSLSIRDMILPLAAALPSILIRSLTLTPSEKVLVLPWLRT